MNKSKKIQRHKTKRHKHEAEKVVMVAENNKKG